MEDKKNWRRDDLATRIDLRMPNELYDRVVEIATAAGEKVNPKSGQVRLTATLNRLIEIGIRHLSDDNPTISINNPTINPIGIGLESRVSKLEDKYRRLSDNAPTSQINDEIDGLRSELVEVSEFARNLQGEIVEIKKAISVSAASPTSIDKPVQTDMEFSTAKSSPDGESEPDNVKTWGEFFKMVEIEALTAVEAQKKENKTIRNEQIEMGLQAAREAGLGEWAVKVAGRSFARVTPHHHGEVIDVTKG